MEYKPMQTANRKNEKGSSEPEKWSYVLHFLFSFFFLEVEWFWISFVLVGKYVAFFLPSSSISTLIS